VKIKVLATPAGEEIYGQEVVWTNAISRVDAGQPKPWRPAKETCCGRLGEEVGFSAAACLREDLFRIPELASND
jgi:hypothetical protein